MGSKDQKRLSRQFKKMVPYLFEMEPLKEYRDEQWHFFVPSLKKHTKWFWQSFVKYKDVLYWTLQADLQMEYHCNKEELGVPNLYDVREEYNLSEIIHSSIKTLKEASKDWLKHHQRLLKALPKRYRFGMIERKILWDIWPDIYRPDLELTNKEYDELMQVFESQDGLMDEKAIPNLTLNTYFEYCRVAYLANFKKYKKYIDPKMSGLEMYKAMADGRHEGLIDLSPDSHDALTKWYHGGRGGGHPWEICRGGNTTHINLGIYFEREKWFIYLEGNSTSRMLETAKMALAFQKRKMPFRWFQAKDVKLKMQGCDSIGLIPEYHSLHRAYQLFEKEDQVFDCIYLRDLEKNKSKALPFIYWLPMEPIHPKNQRVVKR